MNNQEIIEPEQIKIGSEESLNEQLRKSAKIEQLYTIALFDILGFSEFVEQNGMEKIRQLYDELVALINSQKSSFYNPASKIGSVAPTPVSDDWKYSHLVAQANGYVNVCHFSDTFLLYVNYEFEMPSFLLSDTKYEEHPLLCGEIGTEYNLVFYNKHKIYISFLQTCMDFFCRAILKGIPLRGCISTGLALMDKFDSIFIGKALVEAARGESYQNSIGFAFGRSFNNHHPVYNDYFIPYESHIKDCNASKYLSPMCVDWPRHWRKYQDFKEVDLIDAINKMNTNSSFSSYYDKAIDFVKFSDSHPDWHKEIDYNNVNDIIEYYNRTKFWLNSLE